MTAHKIWYDSIPHGFEHYSHRENYRSDTMLSADGFPEIEMDENDFHEHMLLKALDAKEMDVTELRDEHRDDEEEINHCSLPSLQDDDDSYALIDEESLLSDVLSTPPLATDVPVKPPALTSMETDIDDTTSPSEIEVTIKPAPSAVKKEHEQAQRQQQRKAKGRAAETKANKAAGTSSAKSSAKSTPVKAARSPAKASLSTASAVAAVSVATSASSAQTSSRSNGNDETTVAMAVESNAAASVDIPGKFDVLCGQSRICASHTGNRRFQVVLDIYASTYEKATTKQEKMSLTKEIVSCISTAGGRFLKYSDGVWVEIPNVTARDKVSHALRTKVASWKRQKQSSPSPGRPSRRASKPSRSRSATAPGTSRPSSATKHKSRRSSTSIAASSMRGGSSFDSSSSSIMDDLLRSQREIFASLTGNQNTNDNAVHPLKR